MDEAGIPEIEDDEVPTLKTSKISKVNDEIEVVEESEEVVIEEEEILFEDDEMDPNY
jgi:hypothetical protein